MWKPIIGWEDLYSVNENGEEFIYEFKKDLSDKLGITTACVKNYLHKKSNGYTKYGIILIEYI